MERHLSDDLDRRLRAARPRAAHVDAGAFDADLLARISTQPISARRTVPRAVAAPAAAGATLAAAAVVMLAGAPGDVGGPAPASAIAQALRWLDPAPGTVLHVRSVETAGTETTARELWQSADRPAASRMVLDGARDVEISGDALYDPARDTIYAGAVTEPVGGEAAAAKAGSAVGRKDMKPAAEDAKPVAEDAKPAAGKPDDAARAADPFVEKIRSLLEDGRATVARRERHGGEQAWAISLKPGADRPQWTLWVSAADGRPLELRDPGRDADAPPMTVRWTTYEVLPAAEADEQLTLAGAHPGARVVDDAEAAAAARERLLP